MSLDTVVDDVLEEARQRREEIIEAAEADAEAIVADAEDDAEEIVATAEEEVEREIEQEREQTISSANLEAKQERLEARRELLADVREEVETAIGDIGGDDREELTRTSIEAASQEFVDDADVKVYARDDDEQLVRDILTDYDGYEYAGAREILGGVIVESAEARVRVDNTFDSILDEVWEDELKDVSEILFDR